MATSVGRVTEISASSDVSFEDAVKAGIERANKTLRGVTGAWIKEQKLDIVDGTIVNHRVNMLVTFIVDD
jgi:flavin-binding protein dodecin